MASKADDLQKCPIRREAVAKMDTPSHARRKRCTLDGGAERLPDLLQLSASQRPKLQLSNPHGGLQPQR